MKRYRRQIPTLFLLPIVLFLIGAELSREEKVGLWKEQFEGVRQFREGEESLSVWKPRGIRASEEEALALLAQPKVHPLANTVAQSGSSGSQLVFPQVADGTNQDANLRIITSIILPWPAWFSSSISESTSCTNAPCIRSCSGPFLPFSSAPRLFSGFSFPR